MLAKQLPKKAQSADSFGCRRQSFATSSVSCRRDPEVHLLALAGASTAERLLLRCRQGLLLVLCFALRGAMLAKASCSPPWRSWRAAWAATALLPSLSLQMALARLFLTGLLRLVQARQHQRDRESPSVEALERLLRQELKWLG